MNVYWTLSTIGCGIIGCFVAYKMIWEDSYDSGFIEFLMSIFIVGLCSLLPICIWAVITENNKWQVFKVEHNCKIVGKMTGDVGVGTGIGANGNVTTIVTSTPGKTGWLCDNGVTYWR